MKTYRKETFLISICTLFLFVFVFLSIGNATQTDVPETTGSVETTTTLSITGGTKSVFTPTSINFGELEVSSSEQEKNIELEAPNYFGIEDLKGQGGYYTTLQIGELSDGDKTLEVTEAKVRIANLEVHTIAGQEGSNISVPDSASDFILFDSENPANILERAVTTNGKIGKYGVLPHIKLVIAPYQQVGDYEGTITFTIIEEEDENEAFQIYLSDIEYVSESNIHGYLHINRLHVGNDIEVNGVSYDSALGMHAPINGRGEVIYNLPEGSKNFNTKAGITDSCPNDGSINLYVLLGNNNNFTQVFSKLFNDGSVYDIDPINLEDYSQIKLQVDNADGNIDCDHGAWINPKISS